MDNTNNINRTLLSPLMETTNRVSGLRPFIDYINSLEGYKTKIKNLHWAASGLNIHKELDEFLEILSNYQDSIAEECQGIYGQFNPNDIRGIQCDCIEPIETLQMVKQKTFSFYNSLQDIIEMKGIMSETETFIHEINKHIYLFRLCRG